MARRRVQSPAEDDVVTDKAQAKTRKSTIAPVNSESQQLLAVGSMLSKPPGDAEDLNQLHDKMSKDKKKLKSILDRRMQQAEVAQSQRREEMSAALLSALQPQARSTRDGQDIYPGTRISVNTSTDVLDEVLAASGYLLAEYARLNNVIAELHDGQTTFDAGAWDKEVSVTEDKLKLGARVALKRVDRALGAVGKHEGGDDKIPDDDMEGVDIEQHKEDLKFFKSLHYAQRGVRRMIKAVPGNEE